MKIKEPDWIKLWNEPQMYAYAEMCKEWFTENIAPYEFYDPKEAVEVYSSHCKMWDEVGPGESSHKALLINIEPIKKETAEDVLRDLLELQELVQSNNPIWARAKAVLGEK